MKLKLLSVKINEWTQEMVHIFSNSFSSWKLGNLWNKICWLFCINVISQYTKLQWRYSSVSENMLAGLVLTLYSLVFSSCDAVNRGSVQVEGYGEVWVISPDWANVKVEGNGFTLYGNSRMYFASRPTDGFDADAYWQVILSKIVLCFQTKKLFFI